MVYAEHVRRRLRISLIALAGLGFASLCFGFAAPSLAPDVAPVPVVPGTATALPPAGLFGGTLALYGAPTDELPATAERLGCRLQDGRSTRTGLSPRGAADLDRRVVAGTALRPQLVIRGSSPEWTITCDGAGSLTMQPMYLITSSGQRDLVPMAAFSFATLALVLGVAGGVRLRPQED